MQKAIDLIARNPWLRALVLIVAIIPISFYLGTSPVRRGFLYYAGVFAPSLVAAVAAGIWTWTWRWLWIVLAICVVLTILIQLLAHGSG
jgi:hypothetical protein